ncbi:DUF4350 domain-containing protein [Mucilaginibacter panaciglaebae]|uniref:Unsaturated rhamnogalacturonyl hydrolase n=1 Tax=Mucilaginibacter panaciglaebae TaxID=502331 RepID=A0ABP7W9P1_9SPHI
MYRLMVFILLSLFAIVPATFAQTVTLDSYFNHETHKISKGTARFHYLWDDEKDSGFSIWADIFKTYGFALDTLGSAPTVSNLINSSIYIIVDPDTKKETVNPNYIQEQDADQITQWVKAGGVLVLMANDSANVELTHFNILAGKFGLHFNNDLQNHVLDDKHFADGIGLPVDKAIFPSAPKTFLKDVCSIGIATANAKSAIKSADGQWNIAVTLKYGKGTVFAVGDPWLYNEYVNGRLPGVYKNDIAAKELTSWLKKQIKR